MSDEKDIEKEEVIPKTETPDPELPKNEDPVTTNEGEEPTDPEVDPEPEPEPPVELKFYFYVHPLPHRSTSFAWIGYWIYDEIVSKFLEGKDFEKDFAEYKYSKDVETLAKAFKDYGDVDVMESRNGYIHKLSNFKQGK